VIVERMSGRAPVQQAADLPQSVSQETILAVRDLSVPASSPGEEASSPVHEASFNLHRGEILGLYGLLGAGRTELLEALAGCRSRTGTVLLKGHPVPTGSVPAVVRAGMTLVPEDRQRDGLVPELSVRENIALAASGVLLSKSAETAAVRQLIEDLQIAVKDIELPVAALSGGNQQKVLLARCLMRSPSVLLLDEPTRGVDAGAKVEIYRTLRTLASRGLGILFTSSEIEETRELADRVFVLCQGHIAAEFARSECSDEALFAAASPRVAATFTPSQGARA
jgi:erythritol transport system ATP-binding protein